jgi:hypothetical protein
MALRGGPKLVGEAGQEIGLRLIRRVQPGELPRVLHGLDLGGTANGEVARDLRVSYQHPGVVPERGDDDIGPEAASVLGEPPAFIREAAGSSEPRPSVCPRWSASRSGPEGRISLLTAPFLTSLFLGSTWEHLFTTDRRSLFNAWVHRFCTARLGGHAQGTCRAWHSPRGETEKRYARLRCTSPRARDVVDPRAGTSRPRDRFRARSRPAPGERNVSPPQSPKPRSRYSTLSTRRQGEPGPAHVVRDMSRSPPTGRPGSGSGPFRVSCSRRVPERG